MRLSIKLFFKLKYKINIIVRMYISIIVYLSSTFTGTINKVEIIKPFLKNIRFLIIEFIVE